MNRKQMGIILIIVGVVCLALGLALIIQQPKLDNPIVVQVVQSSTEQVVNHENPLIDEKTESEKKGLEFEKWVICKFPQQDYKLIDWKGDKIVDGRFPESSRYPDLEFELNLYNGKVKEKFSVECKWRNAFSDGKIYWASQEKIDIYNEYSKDRNQAVFLVLGVGGEPNAPERVYVIPLNKAQHTCLEEKNIEKYRRKDLDKDFYYYAKYNSLK